MEGEWEGCNARDDIESTVNVSSNPGRPGEEMKHAVMRSMHFSFHLKILVLFDITKVRKICRDKKKFQNKLFKIRVRKLREYIRYVFGFIFSGCENEIASLLHPLARSDHHLPSQAFPGEYLQDVIGKF